MFNVTIIKVKDVVKIVILLISLYVLSRFIFKNISIKNYFNQSISFNTSDFIKFGINTESTIIKNISNQEIQDQNEKTEEVEEDTQSVSIESIFHVASSVFEAQGLEENLGQEEKESTAENTEETSEQEVNQVAEASTELSTQVVTENPITESYNREYNGVKIKNETSYELTDEMLNTSDLNINTENVILFHTHTCESYTPSENYQYTASRKLSYYGFKLFCSTSRR